MLSWARASLVITLTCGVLPHVLRADDGSTDFFESRIRPLLLDKCSSCHGADEQSGGLRVDQRSALLAGGETAAAVVPGKPATSLLLQAVRRQGELQMPPDEALRAEEIEALEHWIRGGAVWPDTDALDLHGLRGDGRSHWAFQPIDDPQIPEMAGASWVRNPIDAFILEKLRAQQLSPSHEADRRTLIRRASFALTGLPPTAEAVQRFVADPAGNAYELLVEDLLASPEYGEHWARHWLDVARYSDTKGYVYAREERTWVHAWVYRDWVVNAFNQDLPYDRFLLLQLAADQVDDRGPSDLAAMGFLTLGRRFLGVERDIIDDRIDVVCRGTMGLTVSCARCHDHKYDPIPTADYYSLYGVFDSCKERLVRLSPPTEDAAYEQGLRERTEQFATRHSACCRESADRVRNRVADYLFAQSELHKYPANGFDQIFSKDDLLPAFVRRWERYLRDAGREQNPIFVAWHAFAELSPEEFATSAARITHQLQHPAHAGQVHPLIAEAFTTPPQSFREVCDRYGAVFAQVAQQWHAVCERAETEKAPRPTGLDDPSVEAIRQVLFGPQAPCEVPEGPISLNETYFDSGSCTELWKLQGEIDRWIINAERGEPHALILEDQAVPIEPRVFVRGDPLRLGADVPRQFLGLLSGEQRQAFAQGSGRLELAQAIIDPENPLTARVIVNRVWAAHFGQGLVTTPSDFGTRAEPPSHPELLDWLSSRLIASGWSLKQLQRMILLSSTFRQTSRPDRQQPSFVQAARVDPQNRWLWRMNAKRLTFEELRDSLLAAAGELELGLGGRPAELFAAADPKRRTLYGLVDRQYLPSTLRVFDFANPDLHTPQRTETTVPQQALFLMNHRLLLERARGLARLAHRDAPPPAALRTLFLQAWQREPTAEELSDALEFIQRSSISDQAERPATTADWQYGYGQLDSAEQVCTSFNPLPHFTGAAWQGSEQWPDAQLGWVQLTASGGHPGNDLRHAAIRRWTAPDDMVIQVRSRLVHEPSAGDGIRGFVISSQHGALQKQEVHAATVELNVERLSVVAGETIDFVVDIREVLNSDQFLWHIEINRDAATTGAAGVATVWDAAQDFTASPNVALDAWEQLAQVLLCANEFVFID